MKYSISKNTTWKIIKKLSNLNGSIILLLVIASISIFGTIIEQDKNIDYYKLHYPISRSLSHFITWKTIVIVGLDHIYTTWWFLFLLITFVFTLIACTFSRQLPSLRNSRNWKFKKNYKQKQYQEELITHKLSSFSNIIYELNTKHYYVFHKNHNLYAYKGLLGRIAPIFVHISIIMILIGSMIGIFSGFISQELITQGEIFHVQNIIKSGFVSYLPNNITGKIDNFRIEYNSDQSIGQFFSSISLINKKGIIIRKQQIYVNYPLIFRGVTFYQTDWKINAIRININNTYSLHQPLEKIQIGHNNFWVYKLPISNNKFISIIITNTNNKILLYDGEGKFIHSVDTNENFLINRNNIKFKEIITQTGIQIKSDPGIPYVYTGFLILIISIAMSYQSYSQVWIYKIYENLQIHGSTNRSKLAFEEEIFCIQRNILRYKSIILLKIKK